MAFDLYFAGSRNVELDNWLSKNNCSRLFSQLNDRTAISKWVNYNTASHLFIDSGAFTAHTKGDTLNIDDYIEYLNSIDNDVTICAEVDEIPGKFGKPRTKQMLLEAPKKSWDNYLYMRSKLVSPDKCLPVFHQGEDFKWLDNMLEATFDGKHIPYIAISPCNDLPTKQKEPWIANCFLHIKNSSNPNVKVHILGMTSLDILQRYPAYSADSTTWLLVAAMGSVMTPWGVVYISNKSLSEENILCKSKPVVEAVQKYFDNIGFSLEQLSSDYTSRMIANCIYLKNWADNYVYKPAKVMKKCLL